ncbi:MAG: hypothetical protein CVU71_09510 [Deltaproteobacteria bacterium HGW-Deltaproteobacteria-6]|jgi:uncharacterized SAM-binding protein YcdF (DUF218 family)|nr:MAG: hypothetical protein CVU71_09510 [Deltaproteobacteria bacterium HGW-Deltaproteobacteria-6]
MEQVYSICKSFVDPVFIIFILLLISFIICLNASRKKGGVLFLLLMIVLLYGFSIEPVSNYLSYGLEKNYIAVPPAEEKAAVDVVVVLSGGVYSVKALGKTFPSDTTTGRLVHAVRMYQEYDAKYLVCSGYDDSKISGAELMAQMAVAFGVPKARIRMEAKSRNTYEHAIEFNKMFIDKDIRIGLVTSAYHMKRSEKEFQKYFKKVLPLPAGYLYRSPAGVSAVRYIPQAQWLSNNAVIFREYVGQFWYSIKDF